MAERFIVTQRIEDGGGSPRLRMSRAALEVVEGPDLGKRAEVGLSTVVVGTATDVDLTLTDAFASRRHFEIHREGEAFVLRDLASINGTRINGIAVRDAIVPIVALIEAGKTKLRLATTEELVELPMSPRDRFGDLRGQSPAMRVTFGSLERAADTASTLLIEGESGTGKELAAHAVHASSARASRPFVIIDCSALPESLAEAELFGRERGAFTGALTSKASPFEEAEGGTVFLDEIGELPESLQPLLLRALESKQIRRVGSTTYRRFEARFICATNRDLESEVRAGRFRQDLFYRVAVLRVRMPPLRERREDIPFLAQWIATKLGAGSETLDRDTLDMLVRHDWPGNVRELRNVIERLSSFPGARVLSVGGARAEAAPLDPTDQVLALPFHEARSRWNDRFEREYLNAALRSSGDVVLRAAERSAIPRQTFHRLMRKHGIRSPKGESK